MKNPSPGDEVIAWIETYCRVPEGAHVGQPVVLRDWQRAVIRGIYDSPTRRAIVSFGRKNGKTALAAFLLLVHLCGPRHLPNSQLFSAAQSRDQAAVLFALAAKVVRQSPDLSAHVVVRDTAKQLACHELGTLYRALSADASTAYGLSSAFTVHDELGQVRGPRSELYDALETAAGAHDAPLSVVISTQAPTDADLLSVLIDDAKTGADPRTKLFLYTAPHDLDPFSEDAWRAANPALGDFLSADEVRQQAESARRMPSRESNYRNLILNQRVSQTSPFIPRAIWEACSGDPDPSVFESCPVYAGLDLSARQDLTALVLLARDAAGAWHCRPFFWAPEVALIDRARRDRAPYDVWKAHGFLETTPGASVDYAFVAQRIAEIASDCDLRTVAYDRWRIDVMRKELDALGVAIPLAEFGQGFKDMSPALDSLEGELANGRVLHGSHPVLTWCASNAIATRDPAGNRKLDKSKATGRIDGMVAMAMAIGAAARDMAPEQVEPGIYIL